MKKKTTLVVLAVLLAVSFGARTSEAGDAKAIVKLINISYGRVATAKLEGWFTKTLRIDWTANTRKIHAMKIFSEIAGVKSQLYNDGVRYFQFPNDAGTYNIIDWKTGKKTSDSDRARYYFR